MNKNDIETREDIFLLVTAFYVKVRRDHVIGHFFNDSIKDWDAHLQTLTLFWESNLFLQIKYLGNPIEIHNQVNHKNNKTITELHFGVWLNLWFKTIDELFMGDVSEKAKLRARKMSTFLYLNIFQSRNKKTD
jgi:hemoglobin